MRVFMDEMLKIGNESTGRQWIFFSLGEEVTTL